MNIYDQIYNEKLGELIKDITFPFNDGEWNVHEPTFDTFVLNALRHHTPQTLSCSLAEYKQVYLTAYKERKWFMPEMFVALSAVRSLQPKDSLMGRGECLDIEMWIGRHEDWQMLSDKWNTIAAPYMEQARKFAEDKARRDKRQLEAKSKLVQLNGKQLHAK